MLEDRPVGSPTPYYIIIYSSISVYNTHKTAIEPSSHVYVASVLLITHLVTSRARKILYILLLLNTGISSRRRIIIY